MRAIKSCIAALGMLVTLSAFAADPPDFTVKKVADGIYAAVATPGGEAGSNSGFILGGNGVIVIDTFLSPDPAAALLGEIHNQTQLPVRYVVNTHYHLDHTGGNSVFADRGASIVAQRNVRAWEQTENLKFFGANPTPEQKARIAALVLPDLLYIDGLDVYLGSRLVQVRYMLGHTGGDSVVFVPDANVVFAGDLVWTHHLPNLVDASTDKWIATLDKLLADHASAAFIAGHGGVATANDVRDFRDYLVALRQAVAKAQAQGKLGQALVDAVTADLQPKYSTWGFFSNFIKRNIEQTAAELAGGKKVPKPVQQP